MKKLACILLKFLQNRKKSRFSRNSCNFGPNERNSYQLTIGWNIFNGFCYAIESAAHSERSACNCRGRKLDKTSLARITKVHKEWCIAWAFLLPLVASDQPTNSNWISLLSDLRHVQLHSSPHSVRCVSSQSPTQKNYRRLNDDANARNFLLIFRRFNERCNVSRCSQWTARRAEWFTSVRLESESHQLDFESSHTEHTPNRMYAKLLESSISVCFVYVLVVRRVHNHT